MVSVAYIILSPQEENVHFPSWGHRCTHSAVQSSKRFKPICHYIIMVKSLLNWKKTQTRNSTVFIVLRIWPGSTLKFLFLFGFNECLLAILSLLSLWFHIWVAVVWPSIFQHRWLYIISHSCPWIKNVSAKTTKSVPKCWERSVKGKSNLNFIRVKKNSPFNQHFLYTAHGSNYFKNYLMTISCSLFRISLH